MLRIDLDVRPTSDLAEISMGIVMYFGTKEGIRGRRETSFGVYLKGSQHSWTTARRPNPICSDLIAGGKVHRSEKPSILITTAAATSLISSSP